LEHPCHRQTESSCPSFPIVIGGAMIDKAIAVFRVEKSIGDSPARISRTAFRPHAHMPTRKNRMIANMRSHHRTDTMQAECYQKMWRFRRSQFPFSYFFLSLFITAAEIRADNPIIIARSFRNIVAHINCESWATAISSENQFI
jgi:hypothetical protein